MSETIRIAHEWLADFESKVNARDFAGGRKLFKNTALGFGSRLAQADNLDSLVEGQWKRVWPNTEEFQFNLTKLSVFGDAAAGILALALPWTSTGFDSDDRPYFRPGRCTLVIERNEEGVWLCGHSHYSLPIEVSQDLRQMPKKRAYQLVSSE